MDISDNIKVVAKQHGMTISKIAEKMGIYQQQLSRTINNERITLQDLEKIAAVIGCDVSDFLSSPTTLRCPHCGKRIRIIAEE